uniref:BTB domain-containing protein n=1 Tax=Timema douglasi TaxID=61478 RepID=A0A7R8VPH4_TIMDO|nr:unnamed protein product [Timema douglasi]
MAHSFPWKTTKPEHVYKNLFLEGQYSDITICALEKSWNLHRLYLKQSPFFQSKFSDSCLEGTSNTISLNIDDPNVTVESLQTVLVYLYTKKVDIDASTAVKILAAASMLQLDAITEQCISVMTASISVNTAVEYYEAGIKYEYSQVTTAAFDWMLLNLFYSFSKNFKELRKISVELMTKLVASSDLAVELTEFSVYTILKLWVLLKIRPDWEQFTNESDVIETCKNDHEKLNLQSDKSKVFKPAFQALRLPHILCHEDHLKTLEEDKLFLLKMLEKMAASLYDTTLEADCNTKGRVKATSLDKEGRAKATQSSGLQVITLGSLQTVVLTLDKVLPFPLILTVNYLILRPENSSNNMKDHMNSEVRELHGLGEWETLKGKPSSIHTTGIRAPISVIGTLVNCDRDALDHEPTEAGAKIINLISQMKRDNRSISSSSDIDSSDSESHASVGTWTKRQACLVRFTDGRGDLGSNSGEVY